MAQRRATATKPLGAPSDEQPVQRLLRSGPEALTDTELLAVVLGDGDGEACSLRVAQELLAEVDGLAGLQGVPPQALQRQGIDEKQAAALVAALDLARRFACPDPREGELFGSPSDVATYLFLRYAVRDQEIMGVLYFDSRSRLLWEQDVFRGTLSKMTASPRQLLRPALLRGAAGLLLFHTHPSGDPAPSLDDLEFTDKLAEGCRATGVDLLDHLILGSARRWVSLRERLSW